MRNNIDNILANMKDWHPLTEIPASKESAPYKDTAQAAGKSQAGENSTEEAAPSLSYLQGLSPELKKVLWDALTYPYSSISIRIKRLGLSARAFERAKHEALGKGLLIESSAGSTTYLIPSEKCYKLFDMPCPYKRNVSIEHSFYVGLNCFLLSKDPGLKTVTSEVKLGNSNATSDIVTTGHDGTKKAFEITLTTTNILSNAAKYQNGAFAKIIFLCRNYKLKEAVKATLRESGLDPELLSRIEYEHFSNLLKRQRRLSLY